jgi:hypothetical protein
LLPPVLVPGLDELPPHPVSTRSNKHEINDEAARFIRFTLSGQTLMA